MARLLGPPVVSSRHVPWWLEAEPTHAAVQVRAVRGELAGRLRHVASRRRQRARYERPLEAVEGLRERHVAPALARRGGGWSAAPGYHTRDVIRRHDIPGGEDREPLHDVRQLAHVAGPRVRGEELHRARVEPHRPAEPRRLAGGEVLHQRRNVAGTLAQWRAWGRE